ncbi:hypothetical protein ET33_29330 [Paenibacillus tyrfis]|uniref:Uncharacterized protein n=1 Tax=Paenibacillus tyrfis TaxID=1501230 RepID=A0A081P828_9BACL|nr:hypothetical protein ET33_29330 [Paenibacillus tyrfis]
MLLHLFRFRFRLLWLRWLRWFPLRWLRLRWLFPLLWLRWFPLRWFPLWVPLRPVRSVLLMFQ